MNLRGRDNKSRKELAKLRRRALRLLEWGWPQARVAEHLGVARSTVCTWKRRAAEVGEAAASTGRPGKLNEIALQRLAQTLKGGATAAGFATDLWTLTRIAEVIREQTGQRYTESGVWRLLKRLGFSCQRPTGRARECDEAAIRRWKRKRWPELKKTLP